DAVEKVIQSAPVRAGDAALLHRLQSVVQPNQGRRRVARLEQAQLALDAAEQIVDRREHCGAGAVRIKYQPIVQPRAGRGALQSPLLDNRWIGLAGGALPSEAMFERMDQAGLALLQIDQLLVGPGVVEHGWHWVTQADVSGLDRLAPPLAHCEPTV